MRIIEWPHFLKEPSPFGDSKTAITIGVFDGVHRGHKALIQSVVAFKGAIPVVVTFRHNSHKKKLKSDGEYAGDISSFRQKMAAFKSLGIAAVVIIEFSEIFRRMTGDEFSRILRDHGKMSFLAVGSNFRCGYQLDTDAQRLLELNAERNIPTDIVQVLTEDSITISSSQIRAAINRGDLKTAAAMLGYHFTIDLADVLAVSDKNSACYGVKERGRIIPPPGRYPVLLHGIKDKKAIIQPEKALVEGGNLIIRANSTDTRLESVEFLF